MALGHNYWQIKSVNCWIKMEDSSIYNALVGNNRESAGLNRDKLFWRDKQAE
jgi:hypothetical protein